MKQQLKNFVLKLMYACSRKKCIVLESLPDLSDNTKAVFDEMVKRGLNRKYKFVWLTSDSTKKLPILHTKCIPKRGFKRKWAVATAKCIICCNEFVYTRNPKQLSFFLSHGVYVKCPTAYYMLPKEIQYCFCTSEALSEIQAQALGTDLSKMVSLGFPRNDILTQSKRDMHSLFEVEYKKIIVWYPTFRQHRSGIMTGSKQSVPIIWNEEQAVKLNQYAKEHQVLIVLKPHFVQEMGQIREMNLSHIILINDAFYVKNNITSYEFIANCDAMITDYSSVYFDYTLCDKPIGLVWEDYDEYAKKPGFALDMNYYMKGGVKIYTVEDFAQFIKDIADGTDRLQRERREIRDLANYSTDGKNTDRVVNFIIEKAAL